MTAEAAVREQAGFVGFALDDHASGLLELFVECLEAPDDRRYLKKTGKRFCVLLIEISTRTGQANAQDSAGPDLGKVARKRRQHRESQERCKDCTRGETASRGLRIHPIDPSGSLPQRVN